MMATLAMNNTFFMYKQQSASGNIICRDSGGLALVPTASVDCNNEQYLFLKEVTEATMSWRQHHL